MPTETAKRVRVVNKIGIDSESPVNVSLNNGQSAFGEASVADNFAFIQSAPVYNYLPANFRAFTATGGTAGVTSKEFTCTTGTSVGGYGAIQSFRALNYKAGQGGLARFTARFPNGGVANSWQGVGLINLGDELSFGYNGTNFGIWYRHDGRAEVQRLTVTGAPSGSENATVTIDGTGYTVPITNGTVQAVANEIAVYLTANGSGFTATQNDDEVTIVFTSDGNKTGSFAFSSGTATATWSEIAAGVTKTSDFINQADWNVKTRGELDPTKGNVFQIQYQYLGYGDIFFSVEDPETGAFELVHRIKYPNTAEQPSLGNPSMHIGLYAASIGSTTDITVKSASMAAFIQGVPTPIRNPRAAQNTKTGVNTTLTNILTLRNRSEVNGIANQVEVEPLQLSVFTESNKGATIEIYGNTTLGGTPNFQYTGTNLVIETDTAGTTLTGGVLLATYVIPGNSSQVIDLSPLRIRVPPSLRLTIAGRVNSGAADTIGAAIVYYEDV